jgi:hypothetical protein
MYPSFSRSTSQRRVNRGAVRVTARYVSSTLTLEGVVTDVSAEGLFFASEYLDGLGEMIRLTVDLPSRSQPLELRGEVRWVNDSSMGSGMGIRLIDVSLADRVLLAGLPYLLSAGDQTAQSVGNA